MNFVLSGATMSNFQIIRIPLQPETEYEKARAQVDALLMDGWSLDTTLLLKSGDDGLLVAVLTSPEAAEAWSIRDTEKAISAAEG